MKRILVGAFLSLSLTGCTVYKSEGRKQFESEAPNKIKKTSVLPADRAFELISCKKETKLETWLNEEFPSANYEVVVLESDLEIWRTQRNKIVEVKALQRSANATTSCIYHFSNDIVWNLYKDQFVKELQSNLMTLD